MKEIDLDKTVFELTEQYPELIALLVGLGFLGIKNPIVRNTVGRVTTLRQGCEKQGKDLNEVVKKLQDSGFTVKST